MIPKRVDQYNTHAEFIGIPSMIKKLRKSKRILEKSLAKGDYQKARNQDFAIWCCPNKERSKFGYKYTIYDEWEVLKKLAFEEYVETHKLILQSYGFDCDEGRFSIDVPPIDINSISIEFMQHIAYPAFGEVNNIGDFVCGFIDAGYQFIYNGHNENESWILARNKGRRYYMNVEKVNSCSFEYEVPSFHEKILLENKEYTYNQLTKCKCIKSYNETEYHKTRILKDKYGCLWLYVYDENDHLYHIEEYFIKIDNMECVNEQGKIIGGNKFNPCFYAITGHRCFRFILNKVFKDIPTDKEFEIHELRELQRINGIIPIIGEQKRVSRKMPGIDLLKSLFFPNFKL